MNDQPNAKPMMPIAQSAAVPGIRQSRIPDRRNGRGAFYRNGIRRIDDLREFVSGSFGW